MNLSFAGCGFLGIYHVGVAVCFRKYVPHVLLEKISGASAGAIAACCLLCDLPIGGITSDVLRVALEARQRALGPFSPSFNIQTLLLDGLERFLPEDAHIRVSGKLHISLTRVYDGKNVVVSHFNSREDLLQALLATTFVPVFSGVMPPKFHGVRYMDGGFSDNLPVIDENTVTVSPFCGESDICPRDPSSQLFHVNFANTSIELSRQNLYRFTKILFPPTAEVLASMCRQGFDDALTFLHRNNLINCTRCLSVQSTYVVADTLNETCAYDPECQECKLHRQESLVANLPDQVMKIFQDAIKDANQGLFNWVFKQRGMKFLTFISLPYIVPIEIVCATITNLRGQSIEKHTWEIRLPPHSHMHHHMAQHAYNHYWLTHGDRILKNTPNLSHSLWEMTKFFMDQVKYIFNDIDLQHNQISCEVEVSNYGGLEEKAVQKKKKKKYNFTLNLEKESETGNLKLPQKILSRHSSVSNLMVKKYEENPSTSSDVDAFDHILKVSSQHEAIMAFYYMDVNKQMKVTEIYDVTEVESNSLFTQEEIENNENLIFDDNIEEPLITSTWSSNEDDDFPHSPDYFSDDDRLSGNLFSDPESEWANCDPETASLNVPGSSGILNTENFSSDSSRSMPESDQSTSLSRHSSYHVLTTIDDLDYDDSLKL